MITISSMGLGEGAAAYLTQGCEDYYAYEEILPFTAFYDPDGVFDNELHGQQVDPVRFKHLCAGRHYLTGLPLTKTVDDRHRAGVDLTFSVPKSLSIIHALGSESIRKQIDDLHNQCVKRSLNFFTDKAAFTRYKVNGEIFYEKTKLLFALFPHHESRAGDMQEHIHVATLNICKNSSGNYAAIDTRSLFVWRTAAAARYHVDLAYTLMNEAKIYCERDGMNFKCSVVPDELCEYFSSRRATIKEVAEELHDHIESRAYGIETEISDLARQVLSQVPHLRAHQCDISDVSNRHIATIISKITRDKKVDFSHSEYLSIWEKRAQESGIDLSFLDRVASNSLIRKSDPVTVEAVKKSVLNETLLSLTEQSTTFTETVLHEKLAENSIGLLSLDEVDQLHKQLLGSRELVPVKKIESGLQLYTTVDQIKLELGMKNYVCERQNDFYHKLSIKEIADVLPEFERDKQKEVPGFKLTEEQKRAIVNVGNLCGGVAAYEGLAGTGKSNIANVLERVYRKKGYKVLGYAFSKDAAKVLEKSSGIKSRSLDALLTEHFINQVAGNEVKLDKNTVIIIDESGMVGGRKGYSFLNAVKESGAKLIFSGDDKQTLPILAGQISGLIASESHATKIGMIRRQALDENDQFNNSEWRRDIVRMLLKGEGHRALQELDKRNHIHLDTSNHTAILSMVKAWHEQTIKGADCMMVATKNEDVQEVSALARAMFIQDGTVLKETEVEFDTKQGPLRFAVGDRIRLGMNYKDSSAEIDISNGSTGVITNIVKRQSGYDITYRDSEFDKEITINTDTYITHKKQLPIRYNYCSTIYASQGKTVDNVFVFASDYMDRRLAYVAASRNRFNIELYAGVSEWSEYIEKRRPWMFEKYNTDVVTREMLLDEIGQRFSQPSENALAIEHLSTSQVQQALSYEPVESVRLSKDHRYQVAYEKHLESYLQEHSTDFKSQVDAGVSRLERTASIRLSKLNTLIESVKHLYDTKPPKPDSLDLPFNE